MTTLILWIGHGERANELEWLFELLDREPLDPLFEKYGAFRGAAEPHLVQLHNEEHGTDLALRGSMHYHGNFYNYSCTFSVYTDDASLIDRFDTAIKANRATVAYKEARDVRREQARHKAEQERLRQERYEADRRRYR